MGFSRKWIFNTLAVIAVVQSGYGASTIGGGFAKVGAIGNAAYASDRSHTLDLVGRGSVDYEFSITRSQISTGEWFEFYNSFSTQSDDLEQRIRPRSWDATQVFVYQGPGRLYTLDDRKPHIADRPLSVRRESALMYANWLHNDKSSNPEDLFRGAYDFDLETGEAPDAHQPDARYRLPTLDEYFKAMYFAPGTQGGELQWFAYRHSSNQLPNPGLPSEGGETAWGVPNSVLEQSFGVFGAEDVPLAAYPVVQSPWGLLDQYAGEAEILGIREFVFSSDSTNQSLGPQVWRFPSGRFEFDLNLQELTVAGLTDGGFRIVTLIPGPSPMLACLLTMTIVRKRRR